MEAPSSAWEESGVAAGGLREGLEAVGRLGWTGERYGGRSGVESVMVCVGRLRDARERETV